MSHREVKDGDALKRKAVSATEQGTCTKLLVRNIPFQASIKEIETLFASFGEIKSIRIPKKVSVLHLLCISSRWCWDNLSKTVSLYKEVLWKILLSFLTFFEQ